LNSISLIKIDVADEHADMKQATDFIVNVKGGTVAVRIRRSIGSQYKDLTIRSRRPYGTETELQKIRKGFADYYLYIWTQEEKVIDWWLVDINKIRSTGMLDKQRREIWNKDKSSAFIAIKEIELKSINALISTMNSI
jgi:hypothetical protein